MTSLNDQELEIVILALSKVLENEQPYTRVDEYKKLLDRLKANKRNKYVDTRSLLSGIDDY